jgi:hypothetical protein
VHANTDDGIEFFGGTTDIKYAVTTDIEDDNLDWTFGWQGDAQFFVISQSPGGDQGIEADNNSGGNTLTPRSQPRIANVTFVGSDGGDIGLLFRAGTGVNFTNGIVTGFGDGCLDIDDEPTFSQSVDMGGNLNGTLTVTNTILNCNTNFIEEEGDLFGIEDFFTGQDGNMTMNPNLNGFLPGENAPYLEGFPMDPAVFNGMHLTDFIGAFRDPGADWTAGWTEFLDR